ncbi:MAG: ERF family protein [Ilumatobacteraceae bacterium]|nr:ERF family protein [Ilumatobacteraceae bacterium]
MTINEKLTKIQTEFKSKKSRFNSFGKYYFRSAEDILEATKPFLKELEVSVTINEELIATAGGGPVLQCTATIHDGDDSLSATAIVGVDLDQKGMQMPQRYGAASSYGKKYALGNLFLIDDTQDSDATNTHGKNGTTKKKLTEAGLTKAKEYVAKGGSISTIKNKYIVSANQEELLIQATL